MRALVLSGGGPLAVAWESGFLTGLEDFRPRDADFIFGTSAGAIVGAQLAAGSHPAWLASAILAEVNGAPPPGATKHSPDAVAKLPGLFTQAHGSPDNPAAARAKVGAYALAAKTESEEACAARFAAILRTTDWPTHPFGCAVVDAADGSVRILTADCGGSLDRAVAASCSLPGLSPPMTIAGRRYLDGGLASIANVDLMAGYTTVLILAFRAAGPSGDRIEARLDGQVTMLREGGANVLAILPNAMCQGEIGTQTMDASRRPEVVRAAIEQGRAEAARVIGFWTDRQT